MTASLPEEVIRSWSMEGKASATASAMTTSRSVGAP